MAQFGEEVLKSFVKCIIQGIFVGYHGRTRTISYITRSGIVRRQKSDKADLEYAWESTIRKICLATLGIVRCIQRSRKQNGRRSSSRTKKERIFYCQERLSKNLWRLSAEDFTSCMRILKLTDTSEVVRDTRCLLRMEKATKPREDEFRE